MIFGSHTVVLFQLERGTVDSLDNGHIIKIALQVLLGLFTDFAMNLLNIDLLLLITVRLIQQLHVNLKHLFAFPFS